MQPGAACGAQQLLPAGTVGVGVGDGDALQPQRKSQSVAAVVTQLSSHALSQQNESTKHTQPVQKSSAQPPLSCAAQQSSDCVSEANGLLGALATSVDGDPLLAACPPKLTVMFPDDRCPLNEDPGPRFTGVAEARPAMHRTTPAQSWIQKPRVRQRGGAKCRLAALETEPDRSMRV